MNPGELSVFAAYLKSIQTTLAAGYASEGSHYPSLKVLLESLGEGISATSLPSRIECGAPDFVITKDSTTVGYLEAKDVGKPLDEIEQGKGSDGERFQRYLSSLPNLVLTNYLEFRWYVNGAYRLSATLGRLTKEGKIKRDKDGEKAVGELLGEFLAHRAEGIGTPKELALRMARLAQMIRSFIVAAFQKEPESESLHVQLSAFRDNLIPDLSVEQFADMYAQTIAYGYFAARCASDGGTSFTRQSAAYLVRKTNPFLRKLFYHIAFELDDRIAWLVDDLVQLLAKADMEAIRKDFGKRTAKEDAVVHFYETFLKEYDPKIREMRGVYYTPEPVVSYIVRSIDHLLKTRFKRPQGLADEKTLILDPAAGTATFLYMVINEIHQTIISQGQQSWWSEYVEEKLLPRLFGFELLMAPYAVAHLKLELLLQETGYHFQGEQRLGIYLTNTLEEAFKKSEQLAGFNEYIVEEANAAAQIKKEKPIMVVLGNPPYSGHSVNRSEVEMEIQPGQTYVDHLELKIMTLKDGEEKVYWSPVEIKATSPIKKRVKTFIGRLIEDYKIVDNQLLKEKNPKWLQDDYVKFIRFGQWRIELTGQGILAFITNHSYLDNPTFRGMRQSLMNSFTDIYILNLHGNVKKKEVAPDGSKDENVFDIQQGVAIGIFIKEPGRTGPATVHYAELWGKRGEWPNPREGTKYHTLLETDIDKTEWLELTPSSPFYLFVPVEQGLLSEYEKGWKITDIFPVNSVGIVTARDELAIRWSQAEVQTVVTEFASLPTEEARERYNLGSDVRDWKVALAQKDLKDSGLKAEKVVPILYRPFDTRYTYYTGHSRGFHCMPRLEVMRHMLAGENLALCIGRAGQVVGPELWDIIYCSDSIQDFNLFYRGGNVNFPLYLYAAEGEMQFEGGKRRPNLKPDFIKAFSKKLGLEPVEDGRGDLTETFGPEDIFHYAYAVFHSPTYRTRYAEFLKIDFPRLPLTSDKELFSKLVAKGAELVSLHLMESPVLNNLITRYPVTGTNTVEKVTYDENNQRVYINKAQYFEGVPPEVWNFHIGGYQVCQKWLKDRKGRNLTLDEAQHYQKIVVAIKKTIRLMEEIDELIPGWPME
ncbi:MAG TPA: N-6 DNA methylase [Dehalococcoidia bacterium]|jgi:predicted helicase|nr:N-6 DNA methylase [Dehalococcoidia bacterium]